MKPLLFHGIEAFDPLMHWGGVYKADRSMLPAARVATLFLQYEAGTERILSAAS
jgi:hypothetical protein